jgi:hypothetical protein
VWGCGVRPREHSRNGAPERESCCACLSARLMALKDTPVAFGALPCGSSETKLM